MSLSTFSSKNYIREIPLNKGRVFLQAFVATLILMLCLSEIYLRLRKFPPLLDTTESLWFQNLKSVSDDPNSTDIVFYGTSRTQLAVSPSTIVSKFRKFGRPSRCWNLALSASTDTGLLAHVGENLQADVVIVELTGLQFSTPIRIDDINLYERAKSMTQRYHFEQNLKRSLAKKWMIFRDNVMLSLLWSRYHKLFAHDDGWIEAVYNKNAEEIARQKIHNESFPSPEQVPLETARINQKLYQDFFNRITDGGAHLVILRMPVDGKHRKIQDELLSVKYHTDFVQQNSDILYIDSNINPILKKYRTTENSHLDASDAREFSKDLANILDAWLKTKNL